MSGRLQGKVAVITGTGSGMGREAARRFTAEGARVIGADRDAAANRETLSIVRSAGGEMESVVVELADEAAVHDLMARGAEQYGGIDILYNNAMAMKLGSPVEMTLEDFTYTLTHTLTIHFIASKHVVPHLRRRGGGSILFISSVSGQNFGSGFPGNSPILFAYSTAKAGLNRLSTCLSVELAADNIRVNTISPAWVATPPTLELVGTDRGSEEYGVATETLLYDRLGRPEEIVSAAVFLSSDEASFITGANLNVDGGQLAGGGLGAPSERVETVFERVAGRWLSRDTRWSETQRAYDADRTFDLDHRAP